MVVRNNTHSLKRPLIMHIDMTPLVDLAFLLLIFFMFLLTLQTPKAIEVRMPEHMGMGCGPRRPHTTLIVSPRNKVYIYEGVWHEEKVVYQVFDNQPKQLEKYLLQLRMQTPKIENRRTKEMEYALSIWIKAEDSASYKDVISALDMVRNLNVKQYGLLDITQSDMDFLKNL